MSEVTTYPQRPTGLVLVILLSAVWLFVHIYSVFFHNIAANPLITIGLIACQTWLYTGLFICSHDAMHGTLTPNNPKLNNMIGRIILFYYAGFHFDKMKAAHMDHHEFPGTNKDPDFNADNPKKFWPWYFKFFTTYFDIPQFLTLFVITIAYIALGASYANTIIMWAVPAVLSSVQLFYFGTFLTHRHDDAFPDHHNARSNNYPNWLSLLTCFHFGYHHEHHLFPNEPWWRLPSRKREQDTA